MPNFVVISLVLSLAIGCSPKKSEEQLEGMTYLQAPRLSRNFFPLFVINATTETRQIFAFSPVLGDRLVCQANELEFEGKTLALTCRLQDLGPLQPPPAPPPPNLSYFATFDVGDPSPLVQVVMLTKFDLAAILEPKPDQIVTEERHTAVTRQEALDRLRTMIPSTAAAPFSQWSETGCQGAFQMSCTELIQK